jgi:hypothetical protein
LRAAKLKIASKSASAREVQKISVIGRSGLQRHRAQSNLEFQIALNPLRVLP